MLSIDMFSCTLLGLYIATEYYVSDHEVAVKDGKITVRSVTPAKGGEVFPLFVWVHGGGTV